jgi:hypothetical protein
MSELLGSFTWTVTATVEKVTVLGPLAVTVRACDWVPLAYVAVTVYFPGVRAVLAVPSEPVVRVVTFPAAERKPMGTPTRGSPLESTTTAVVQPGGAITLSLVEALAVV